MMRRSSLTHLRVGGCANECTAQALLWITETVAVACAKVCPLSSLALTSLCCCLLLLQITKTCQWWWVRWTSTPSLGPSSCTSESCRSRSSLMSSIPTSQAASVSQWAVDITGWIPRFDHQLNKRSSWSIIGAVVYSRAWFSFALLFFSAVW